jgi:hypothetical protein
MIIRKMNPKNPFERSGSHHTSEFDGWRFEMREFRVSFYKTLRDASGHSSKHLQRQFDLASDSPSGALVAAEQLFDQCGLGVDCVEVVGISPASHGDANTASDRS